MGGATDLGAQTPPATPFLLYGVLCFCVGIFGFLVGVLLVFPRYLLGLHELLDPAAEWLVWYSGVPVVAGLGLVLNGAIMLALRTASRGDINIRSAFVHMLGDALGSVAIIAGAIVIRYTGWVQVAPVLSIILALLIIWTAWDIVHESLNILLEGLPRGIQLADVTQAMASVKGVLGVHDLHIWSLGSSAHALSCHVLIEDVPPSASDVILRSLNGLLDQRFGIAHTTVQFEHVSCSISENGCAIPVNAQHAHDHPHDH